MKSTELLPRSIMKLTPVSRTTLGEQVAGQLAKMITGGKWQRGERLPAESELRKTLRIGRSTLREALRSLSYVGLVVIKPGDGTYVTNGSGRPLQDVFTHGMLRTREDVDDLFETRIILETELVALCAQRASATDLQKIEALVMEMERAKDHPIDDFASLDIQFHSAIAEGSKNRILGSLFQSINGLLKEMLTKREYILGGHEETCRGHRKIFQALKQRKVREARRAIREHLDGFSANYLREHLADSPPRKETTAAQPEPPIPHHESEPDVAGSSVSAGRDSVVVHS